MILSSPFSRQNRSHQSWTPTGSNYSTTTNNHQHSNGFGTSSLRKSAPPPSQPAPRQPISNGFNHSSLNNDATTQKQQVRSSTLNRLDVLKARQQRQQQQAANNTTTLQPRTLSSLGHHHSNSNSFSNNNNNNNTVRPNFKQQEQQIYAPASIASPAEFVYKSPNPISKHHNNGFIESNHYASASCRTETPSSFNHHSQYNQATTNHTYATTTNPTRAQSITSGSYRSGRESSLGNLLSRFGGSLRRKTRLLSLRQKNNNYNTTQTTTRKHNETPTPSFVSNSTTTKSRSSSETPTLNRTGPPPKVTSLDPEIYGPAGKKEIQAEEIYAEGLVAIDGNSLKRLLKYEVEDETLMSEGETRTLIDDSSMKQINFKLLIRTLINWLNDELSEQRIIVKDLQDDLYDGQVLSKLIEKFESIKLDLVEVTQNELNQKYKLDTILRFINGKILKQAKSHKQQIRYSVEGIHGKNLVEIIFLLIELAKHYKAPIKIPPNVVVQVLIVQKHQGQLMKRSQQVQLTPFVAGENNNLLDNNQNKPASNVMLLQASQIENKFSTNNNNNSNNSNRDVFDTLVEYAPDKLSIVKETLIKFVNRHLNRINMSLFTNRVQEVLDPEQFSDGLLLVFLISSLEDYFVPLGNLFTSQPRITHHQKVSHEMGTIDDDNSLLNEYQPLDLNNNILQTALEPNSYINTQPIHKLHNVNFALQLIEDAGICIKQKVRAEEIVNGDLKSVLRVLYALFSRYKHL